MHIRSKLNKEIRILDWEAKTIHKHIQEIENKEQREIEAIKKVEGYLLELEHKLYTLERMVAKQNISELSKQIESVEEAFNKIPSLFKVVLDANLDNSELRNHLDSLIKIKANNVKLARELIENQ